MEENRQQSFFAKHRNKFLVLVLPIFLHIISGIIVGIYVTVRSLNTPLYETILPPTAISNVSNLVAFHFYFRLIESVQLFTPGWLMAIVFLVVPVLVIVGVIIYLVRQFRGQSKKKMLGWILLTPMIHVIVVLPAVLLVPGLFQLSVFKLVVGPRIEMARNLIKDEVYMTSFAEIEKATKAAENLKVYSDYGSGGLLLAKILSEKKDKLTYFEAFYLPAYFDTHTVTTGRSELDSAELIFTNKDVLVIGTAANKNTLKNILPTVADKFMAQFGPHHKIKTTQLKTFEVIEDEAFKNQYDLKRVEDIKKYTALDQKSYEHNQKIIKNHASNLRQVDIDYEEFVVKEELRYQEGCVRTVIYNDCPQFKKTIEENKIIIAQNRIKIPQVYNEAIKINKEIEVEQEKRQKILEDISKNNQSALDNNLGEYSVGVAFEDDTVYLRYAKKDPINENLLRVMVHELLHINSYNRVQSLPTSLNEGLTDYFATKALGYNELDSIRMAGYAIEIQVIMALLEKIPLDDLQRIYFKQDEIGFRTLMKTHFPDTDYDEFVKEFENIYKRTFEADGIYHSYNKALIDHEEAVAIRKLLNLEEHKFDGTIIY